MKRIAIFASGNGSNAENIIKYFQERGKSVEVALVICNRREAGVYERANRLGIPIIHIPKSEINNNAERVLEVLREYKIDFIVLAGFMLMVPDYLLQAYPNRIINIHPSLLPKFGGKGMHGHNVHKAVVEAGEKESGITIHYVNELCDGGEIIFQAKTEIFPEDTPDDVETKIHSLEKEHFPRVIEEVVERIFGE
ncbi:MAG: phosphoribosylglycinamide formyltransferase [Muribaculaceae bacterium]|nr:phosphoribosylglycinamide formyltransferase [Muribaculaceae bacterium]MDE6682039.1 phosphoribosylglycinamide formyltransferase [Muribaculaceae bacterium]